MFRQKQTNYTHKKKSKIQLKTFQITDFELSFRFIRFDFALLFVDEDKSVCNNGVISFTVITVL